MDSDLQKAIDEAFSKIASATPAEIRQSIQAAKRTLPARPLQDRVIVLVEEQEEKIGDLYIPSNAAEKPQYGLVVAVGPGKYVNNNLVPVDVKEGNRVIFGKYSGIEIKIAGTDYLVLKEDEIVAEL